MSGTTTTPAVDASVENTLGSSIWWIKPESERAREWLINGTDEGRTWLACKPDGDGCRGVRMPVDQRYVEDICRAMQDDGMTLAQEGRMLRFTDDD